jgi:hypothetical protein
VQGENNISHTPTSNRKRPVLVWIFFLLTLYTSADALLSLSRGYATFRGRHIPLHEALPYRLARTTMVLLELAAAAQLFRLRASAVTLFAVALFAHIPLAVVDLARSVGSRYMGLIWLAVFAYITFEGLLLAYALHLRSRGILVTRDA